MSFYLFINGSPVFCQIPTLPTYCFAASPAPPSPLDPLPPPSATCLPEPGGSSTCVSEAGTAGVPAVGVGRGRRGRRGVGGKEVQSAKKNSESNIVNQLYSFFSSGEKSEGVVERAVRALGRSQADSDRIRSIFYNIVRLINYKRGRKYVNRDSLTHFYTPAHFQTHLPDIRQKLNELGLLSLEDLCRLFRIATYYFLRAVSVPAILTSKRITALAKQEHLRRRRRVLPALRHS